MKDAGLVVAAWIIAAHGNSLPALVKHLDTVSEAEQGKARA
jgi:bisphosphoglycerate-dependent phosphoglycerate mutase